MIVLNKPRFLIGMAEAALAQQQIEQAASLLQDAKQYAQENRLGYYEPFITDLTGRIGLAKKQWNQAKEDLEACLQTAGQRRLRPLVLKTCLRLAEVYAGLGLRDDAHASLIQAHHTGDSICELFTDAGHRRLYEDRLHGMFEAAHHQMQVIR